MKHIKRQLATLFFSILCLAFFVPTLWAQNSAKVIDDAHLFTSDEIAKLEKQIEPMVETYQMDFVIHTTTTSNGKTIKSYADDYYDDNGYGYDSSGTGIILVIDITSRKVALSTCGDALQKLPDSVCAKIRESITPDLSKGNYYNASSDFLSKCAYHLRHYLPFKERLQNYTFSDIMIRLGAAILGALVLSLGTFAWVSYRYKHPKQTVPETKPQNGSVHYHDKKDTFVSTHTTKTKIESSSSSHRSGGGRSHGGSSGSF